MFLVWAIALVGSIVIGVMISYCCAEVRDISEAEEELHHRVLLFYQVAMNAKGIEDNNELVNAVHHKA
jgi:hypothetical protein